MPSRTLIAQPASTEAQRAASSQRRAAAHHRALQRRRPRVSRLLAWLLAAWLGSGSLALAQVSSGSLPAGAQVVVGNGQLQQSNNLLIVQQNSARLGLDWQSFNIGSGATVEFRQPGAGSVALNRVLGNSGTEIYGQLKANGQVFLTNPNGVLFAPGAKVDVGGLVASSLDLSQQDFAAGRYIFAAGGSHGAVVNQGRLQASAGGYLALFGNTVSNQGDITVNAGSVVLASGRAATVSISGSGLLSAVVTPSTLQGSVDNSGRILADGGVVTLTAKSAQDIAASLVNNSGVIRANTLIERAGEIWITGDHVTSNGALSAAAPAGGDAGRIVVQGDLAHGRLALDGTLAANASNGRGGSVETSAAMVSIAPSTRVDTRGAGGTAGTWTIDPTDFTVAAGGGASTTSGIGADTLATNLAANNIVLATAAAGTEAGDIHVNADVTWSASTSLTLQAARDVNLNASLNASGAGAALVITPGPPGGTGVFRINTTDSVRPKVTLAGVNASLTIGGLGYTLVRDVAGLQAINAGLTGRYALAGDIDASSTAVNGFVPIGNETSATVTNTGAFSGTFEGLGHVISGLTIERPTSNATGLFASIDGTGTNRPTLRNFELVGGSVTGSKYVGAVVGYARGATELVNVRSSANVSALDNGSSGVWAGGLVGLVEGNSATASIQRSRASGTVSTSTNTGTAYAGGLVGEMDAGTLTDVGASGAVTSLSTGASDSLHHAGGLVAMHSGGNINTAFANGNVTGGHESGGLVGLFQPTSATITLASATGNVSGTGNVGGLVGYALGTGSISNSSATGSVTTSVSEAVSFHAGGAVGRYGMTAAPSAVSAAGNVNGGNTTGGVVGWIQSNIALTTGSLVSVAPASGTKTVIGARWVGGLIGYSDSTAAFSGLSSTATVVATNNQGTVGGLIGRLNASLSNSSSAGSVSGAGDTGGLVGRAQGTGSLGNVSSTASVTGTGTTGAVGGLVGSYTATGSLSDATASGAVVGASGSGANTGGLVGNFSSAGSIVNGSTTVTSTVIGAGDTGGLVGNATGSGTAAITGSTARGAVTGANNIGYVGGLVGDFAMPGGWSNVTVNGAVTGGQRTGGLAGHYNSAAAITSGTYTPSAVSGGDWVGGLVGYVNSAAAISGAAANNPWALAINVTATGVNGGAGGLAGRSNGTVSNFTSSGTVTSGGTAGGLVGVAAGAGGISNAVASGSVTSSSTTTTVGGLLGQYTNTGILSNATATGNVSGGRYTGGLVGEMTGSGSGLNLRAEGAVSGSGDAGGLIGYASGSGTLTTAVALGNVTSSATSSFSVGGALGFYAKSEALTGVTAAGNVAGGAQAGGVIGYYNTGAALAATSISSVIANGSVKTVSGVNWVGGLIGYSDALSITGLSTTANVTASSTSGAAGGLAGRTAGAVANSSAGGNVVGAGDAGGLVGNAAGSGGFTDVSASATVRAGREAGGLIGTYSNSGAITRATASGAVLTSSSAGGLVGQHDGGAVTASSATGTVTAVSDSTVYVGGLIGRFGGNCCFSGPTTYIISSSSASGAVRADAGAAFVGGLVGLMYSGNISASTSSSSVTVLDSVNGNNGSMYTGGLAGYFGYFTNNGAITGSSASGAVKGGYYSGGLVGLYSAGAISDSSASGSVTGVLYIGGLLGYAIAYGTITNVSASGSVSTPAAGGSSTFAGGLVGYLSLQTGGLSNGFASGAVSTTGNSSYVGGLVGYLDTASNSFAAVNDSAATGNVSGGIYTGGLVGYYSNFYGLSPLLNSRASGNVTGGTYAGGLLGLYSRQQTTGSADDITNSFATGAVSGANTVGGLVGDFEGRRGILGSYATGNVVATGSTGTTQVGGLVGRYYGNHTSAVVTAPLRESYASGSVSLAPNATLNTNSNVYAGGLVGFLDGTVPSASSGTVAIADAYATGTVTVNNIRGRLFAGGLVGFDTNQVIQRSYATGAVSATGGSTRAAGGLLAGHNTSTVNGSVTNSFWNTTTTGQANSLGGGTGVASAALLQASTFTGWDLATSGAGGKVWRIYEGFTNPLLTRLLTPLALTLADASKTYDGSTSFGNAALTSGSGAVTFPDRIFSSAPSADVGSYLLAAAGVYSTQNGYDLSVTGGATLTVTPKAITLAGVVGDKVYDGTRTATLLGAAQPFGLVSGEDLAVNLTGASAVFDTKDAGLNKVVTVSGLALADGGKGKASNYSLASATSTTASIAKAALGVGGFTATNRAYDGSITVAVAAASGAAVTGKIGSDDVTVDVASVTSGTVASKAVGTAKAVTVLGATLTGADAGNYRIEGSDTVTVNITPRALTANGLVVSNREYDRSVNVSVSTNSATLGGAVVGDSVQLQRTSLTGTMADKDVAYASPGVVTTKLVTVAGSGLKLRGADAANYAVQTATTTVTINPRSVTFFLNRTTQTDRVYNGTNSANVTANLSNVFGADGITLSTNAATYSDKNVAYNGAGAVTFKTITATGGVLSGAESANYRLISTSDTTIGTISPLALTVTGVAASNRAYNGTVNVDVSVSAATVDTSAVILGDTVSVTLPSSGTGTVTGAVANKNVGTAKAVTVPGFSLSGADAGNYTLTGTGGVTVNITRKEVTAAYSALDKVYNGQAFAALSVTTGDFVVGDDVRFAADQTYCTTCGYGYFVTDASTPTNFTQSKDAGVGKRVVVTTNDIFSNFSNDANNYILLNRTATLSASITPKGITPVFTGVNKVYDGGTTASVDLNNNASGIFSGDAVSLTRLAAFDTKNVGTGKTVSITDIVFTGASAGNYTLATTSAATTAAITPKLLTVQGVTATDRTYDGSTSVALTAGAVGAGGVLGSDVVTVNLPGAGLSTGTVANKNIGNAKPVTVTGLTLGGGDAGNYTLDGSQGVSVNITPKALTAVYVGVDRVYTGGVSAQVTASSPDFVVGDALTYSQNAVFTGLDARNVGSNKPVGITGIVLGGADVANYALQNTTASTLASITPKTISVSYTGLGRVYNGLADVSANVLGSSSGLVAGDAVSFSQAALFTGDGSAGDNKPVAVSNITLGGAQGSNYALVSTTASTTASITKRPIGLTGITATNRTYDGTRVVAVNTVGATADASTIIAGDQVNVALPVGGITTGTMATKDAGTNKDVSVTGLTLTGSAAANYSVGSASGLTVDIAPLSLTAQYAVATKVYDGSALALVTATSGDILSVDFGALGITAAGVFSTGKNVGSGKSVAVNGGFLTGVERNNYTLLNATGTTSANIAPKTLTASYTGGTRVYDGSDAAPVTSSNLGVITGDAVGFAQNAVFTGVGAKNVGNNKAVAVSGIALTGADEFNYTLAGTTATTTASVTRKPISIDGLTGATATDRVYDATSAVAVAVTTSGTVTPSSADIVGADVVQIILPAGGVTTGTMANKNVGRNKPLVVDGLTLTGADAGNYLVAATSGVTVNITPRPLTAVYAGVNKVYDGNTAATATGSSPDVLAGDSVGIAGNGVFTGSAAKDVGNAKAISVLSANLSGTDGLNYALGNPTGSARADITPRPITPGYTGLSKVYDGTDTAGVVSATTGFISGDALVLSQNAVFSGGKNAGLGKSIQISGITLSGSDAGNYSLTIGTATAAGSITPKPMRIEGLTGVSAVDRSYDGTTQVSVTVASSGPIAPNPADIVGSDVVTVNAPATGTTTGTMLDKTVGNAKPVSVAGLSLGGADAANYSITATSGVTVNIAKRQVTATYSAGSRAYDGTTAAAITGSSAGLIGGDVVTIAGNGVFTGAGAKNVGSGKAVDVTGVTLNGADAVNYSLLNATGSTTGTITPRSVTVAYLGGTRIYDGSTSAPVTGNTSGFITGDTVGLAQAAVFSGALAKNVGVGKAVDITGISLTGGDAVNYALNTTTASTTATVTPRPLRIEGFTGVVATDRVYDGSTAVAITVQGAGVIGANAADVVAGDVVAVVPPPGGATAGLMADKNVGSNKPVTVAGITLTGADAGNYSVAAATGVSVNITPKSLTASYTAQSRVYDGTALASISGTLAGIVSGDAISITGAGLFTGADAKNVGIGKAVSITGGNLASADAGNYILLNTSASTSADITPKLLTASYTGGARVYDGLVGAPVSASTSGMIAGDAVGFAQTAVFTGGDARTVGSSKPVQVSGITLQGSDAANYALTATTASTTASVTPRPLNVTGLSGLQAVDRVYDGTSGVAITGTLVIAGASVDVIAGDIVTISLLSGSVSSGTMVDKAAGTGKSVAVAGLTLSGADAVNYQITGTAGLTVNIAPRPVTLFGVSARNRSYDGSTVVAINSTGGSISGVLTGDDLQLRATGVTGSIADKHVGNGRAVTVTGLSFAGADLANYTAIGSGDLRVDITPRTLVATATAADKVYDGNNLASVTLLDDRVAADALNLTRTSATFASKNAGSAQTVNVAGLALTGVDAGDYVLAANTTSTTASIQRAPLAVSAGSLSKVYGETVNLTGSEFTTLGLVAGESIGLVALASAGTAAAAAVNGAPYAITAGNASGGSFNAANYSLSYANGTLQVTPRPVTVAANSIVRTADEANPGSFSFSVGAGDLLGGDSISAVQIATPAGSVTTPGLSIYNLVPTGAVFGAGEASNYALRYTNGLLVVLPRPPRIGEDGGGTQGFFVQVDAAEIDNALKALEASTALFAQAEPESAPRSAATRRSGEPSAAEMAAMVSGDGSRIDLPTLLRMPLISMDPTLRRLIHGTAAARTSAPATTTTP